MVKSRSDSLDQTFGALSHPTRRHMLRMLAVRDRRVSELAAPHDISLPAISKHLAVLERAGMIGRTSDGRSSIVHLRTPQLKAARKWIDSFSGYGGQPLEALEDMLLRGRR